MVKKQAIEISQDKELIKRLEDAHAKLSARCIKLVLFNHENLLHCKRGLVAYNINTREMIAMSKGDEINYAIANDIVFNNKRLEAVEEILKHDNILNSELVYGFFDNNDFFHCSNSKFSRQYTFENVPDGKDYTRMTTIYYNPANENYPKYLIQERDSQFGTCYHCNTLILDELDGADVRGHKCCYKCIVSEHDESYVDKNKWKLMQLHQMEKELV